VYPTSVTRSSTSTIALNSGLGRRMFRSKIFGRAWFPMTSASRRPRVMNSACFSPLRSSSAFVATVVLSRM
jgi:hypothetical protein